MQQTEGIIDGETATKLAKHLLKLGNASSKVYVNGIVQAYTYGYYGYGREAMNGKNTLSATLSEEQRNVAYGLAEQYRAAKTEADQKAAANKKKTASKKAGKVHFNGDRNSLTERQSASLKAMGKIADVLGIQVYVFESKLGKNGRRIGANGWYDPKDGSIHIDLHAGANGEGTMIFTMAHELTHFIRHWSPAKFKILADFLMQEYGKKGVSVDALVREQQAKAKRTGRTISYDTTYEEVVADSMEAMLSDGKVMEKLAKLKAQDAALWQKIKDYISKLAEKIRMAYKGLAPDSIEGRYVAEMKDAVERFQELFTEGLADASENIQAVERIDDKNDTDTRYSIREAFYKEFDAWDKKDTHMSFVTGTTSDVLKSIGMKDQNIILRSGTVLQKLKDHPEMTFDLFKGIPELLEHPVIVQFSDAIDPKTKRPKYDSSITVLGELYADVKEGTETVKKPVLVSLELLPTKKKGTTVLDFAIIKSAYSKNALQQYLNENSILYIDPDKKRTDSWLSRTRLQLPFGENRYGPIRKITYADGKVKVQNSKNMTEMQKRLFEAGIIDEFGNKLLSTRDSDGNQLSKEQQEFFQDSKVRDADGNLMVMYHGTPNGGFTKFRSGTYFTPNPGYADVYQNAGASSISTKRNADAPMTYKVYLDIKRPFDTRQAHEQKIFMEEFYRKYGTGTPLADSGLPDWVDGMDLQEFIEEMGYDYDGLILDEGGVGGYGEEVVSRGLSYVVFDPAQVKGVDNKTPTSDPDYRYSDRDYTYEALTSKPDMVVTTVGKNVPTNRADVAAEAKRNAARVGRFDPKTGSVSVHVDDINTDVILSTKGLRHGLRRSQDPLNVPNYVVTVKAGEILKNSIRVNEITPSDDNAGSSYVLMGAAKDANGTYVVRFVVNHYDNSIASMDVLYALNAKKELAATKSPRLTAEPLSVTSSTISIAELLDLVNEYFPDILPEDVLKHYGYDARPEGDLGDDALYSDRDTDSVSNRSLLANAFEGAAQTDMEKQKIREYRDKIDLMNGQEQKLRKLNQQIKELSFAKGKRDTAKIRALRDEATKTANRISIYDKQLLRLESSKPCKKSLKRAKR
ncbi:MAG: hypothetical protein IJN53_04890 [Oscillospiraceae bacterium]|nr:hypothetical protein [Oscillospiraceae bacterium]